MRFKPGQGGRPKGATNLSTRQAQAIMAACNYCPVTWMIKIQEIAMSQFVEDREKVESGRLSPMESEAAKYLAIAASMAKDLASFAHAKLKSIEQVKDNPFSQLDREQKVIALKQALKALEGPDELRRD